MQTEVQEHFQTYEYGKNLFCLDLLSSLHVHCKTEWKDFSLIEHLKYRQLFWQSFR